MSVFYDIAEDMKEALESVIPSSDIAVIVDRQKSMKSEFNKHIAKVKGAVIIIEFTGAPSTDENANPPIFNASYILTFMAKPILKEGCTPLDDIFQKACQILQHWRGDETHCYSEAKLGTLKIVGDDRFLIYQIPLKKIANIPRTNA